MRVYLVGFMGSGKTCVGALAARELGVPFLDLDRRIEEAAGMPVRRIFERFGETSFRELEHVCLGLTRRLADCLVATGGGTFASLRNRRTIRAAGISVFLDVDFDTIARRLGERGRRERPLFADEARARALLEARLPSYRRADLTIGVHNDDPADLVAARILRAIREISCVT